MVKYTPRLTKVSIHASAREATVSPSDSSMTLNGFNPRLRTGGDALQDGCFSDGRVSIHASAREATYAEHGRCGDIPVSIHASAREATPN